MSLPRARCTRDERREGRRHSAVAAGEEAARRLPGVTAFEVDGVRQTITLMLPVPLMPLPHTETITTDEPAGTHSTPTPKGPQPRQLAMRTSAGGASAPPLTVPLKGRLAQPFGRAGRAARRQGRRVGPADDPLAADGALSAREVCAILASCI